MTLSLSPARSASPAACAGPTRPEAGFTLIEIMFAIVIFGVGVMSLLLCVPMASKRIMSSGAQTRASSLVSEAAEELLIAPYGHSSLTPGTHNDPANPHDGIYYTRWTVENNQPIGSCKRITVTVARGAVTNLHVARLVIVMPQSGG
jgi:prepilin-type N-terminal cleavage/methylation domain-containing protein